jgi:peptide/nickel transport system permease protein
MRYIGRRFLHSLFLLVGVSLLSFAFAELAPGDYFSEVRLDPRVSAETIAGLRARSGLNRPLLVRYGAWVASVAKGDFGYSLAYSSPVGPLLRERIPATLLLTGTATLLAWLLAVPVGIWNATQRRTWRDGVSKVTFSLLLTVPDLMFAIIFLIVAVRSGYFPIGGMVSPGFSAMSGPERVRDLAWHLALPATVLVLGMLPVLVRHVRASMVEAIDSPFALSARAQGIPRRRLLFRHLLPVALNPLIGLFGFSLGSTASFPTLRPPAFTSPTHRAAFTFGLLRAITQSNSSSTGGCLACRSRV